MKKIFTVFLASFFTIMGWAQWDGSVATGFAGGDGSEAAPFEIATAEQLAYLDDYVMANDGASGIYFKLVDDIDLGGGQNWIPIGNWNGQAFVAFKGHLDGNSHVINNMTIANCTKYHVGLFTMLNGAYIKNLGLKNYSITHPGGAQQYVGSMVGQVSGSTIEGCFTEGIINLQGLGNFSMTHSAARYMGGFAGEVTFSTTIANCYTISDVTVEMAEGTTDPMESIGVFAGRCINSSSIVNSYGYGSCVVTASNKSNTEKFCGSAAGTITNCLMNESSTSEANDGVRKVTDEYFKSVDAVVALGINNWHQDAETTINDGLPVIAWQGGTVVEPYTVTVTTVGNGVTLGTGEYAPGASAELFAVADYGYTFSGWSGDVSGTNSTLVIDNIQGDKNITATFVASSTTATTDWNGTTITSVADLMAFSDAVAAGNDFAGITVTLMNDLVMDNTMTWQPIGSATAFAGTFDGNAHTIQGLRIYNNTYRSGLFGYVSGIVKNTGVIDADVMAGGNGKSAILVGYLNGASAVVENCYVSGEFGMLSNGTDVGSVVGRVEGGGATVRNCYSFANVVATGGGTGGVVGTVESGSVVSSCYFAGTVDSPDYYPAIVGYVGGTVENCFFDTEVTGITSAGSGTTASTTAEMKSVTMVDNLNGASNPVVWKHDTEATINNGYPVFTWQNATSTDIQDEIAGSNWKAYGYNGTIYIRNAEVGEQLIIVGITGAVKQSFVVTNTEMSIPMSSGIWIVSHAKSVKKVIVQ